MSRENQQKQQQPSTTLPDEFSISRIDFLRLSTAALIGVCLPGVARARETVEQDPTRSKSISNDPVSVLLENETWFRSAMHTGYVLSQLDSKQKTERLCKAALAVSHSAKSWQARIDAEADPAVKKELFDKAVRGMSEFICNSGSLDKDAIGDLCKRTSRLQKEAEQRSGAARWTNTALSGGSLVVGAVAAPPVGLAVGVTTF